MKPLPLFLIIAALITVASLAATIKPVADAQAYAIRRDADNRAAVVAENVRHQTVLNKLIETVEVTTLQSKINAAKMINYAKGISISLGLIILSLTLGAVAIAIAIRLIGQALATARHAHMTLDSIDYDDLGRLPVRVFVTAGKIRVFNPATNSITTVHDQDIEPHLKLTANAHEVELTRQLTAQPKAELII